MVVDPANMQRGHLDENSQLDFALFVVGALPEIRPSFHFS